MQMKKYVLLYTFTAGAILSILFAGKAVVSSIVPVTTVKLNACTAENYVVCSGKVEPMEETNVYPDHSGVVEQVLVNVGDKVAKDAPIMQIKRVTEPTGTASSSVPADSENYSQYSQYLSGLTSSQINDIADALSSGSSLPPSSSASSLTPEAESSGGTTTTITYLLRSPAAGVIKSLAASKPGDYVASGSPAAVICESEGLRVRLSIDESQVSDLKKGQKVQISGVGFNSTYYGSIISIASEAKQLISTTGQETVVEALASVDHPGSDILPGFNAKAKITTSQNSNALVIPYEAVREDADGKEFVYIVSGGRAKRRNVVTGKELDTGFEVKSGLRENDLVITNPDAVHDGVKIVQTTVGKSESSE